MSNVNGVVEMIGQRGKAYNAKINGDWYGCGFEKPKFEKGDNIKFTVVMNGQYKNIDADSVEVLSTAPAKPAQAAAAPANKDAYWAEKDKRDSGRQAVIMYQSSRKDALEFLMFAYEQGALSIPAKTKVADRLELLQSQLDTVTNSFYDDAVSIGEREGAFIDVPTYLSSNDEPAKNVTTAAEKSDDDGDTDD